MTTRVHSLADWVRLIGSATFATAAVAVISLVANILIFRYLTPPAAGLYALLSAASTSAALIVGFGQPSLLTRLYSLEPIGSYDWRSDLVGSLGLALPLIAGATLIASRVYALELPHALLLGGYAWGNLAIIHLSKILQTQRHYVWGSILLRLPNSLMIVGAILLPFLHPDQRLVAVLLTQLLAIGSGAGLALVIMQKRLQRGSRRIALRARLQGLMFLLANTVADAPFDGILVVSGMFIDRDQIAVFAALFALLRPVLLLYNILNQIFLTELARGPKAHYAALLLTILLGSAAFFVGAVILLPPIASLLYNGQYDLHASLYPLMALSATLYLIEVLPRSHMFARALLPRVNRFILVHAAAAVIGIVAGLVLIIHNGLMGLTQAAGLIMLLRVVVSYAFFILPGEHREATLELPSTGHGI